MYKAIALDLDGTLTDSEKKIPDDNKNAISKALDAGFKVILASGRPSFGIWPLARELELDKKGGYILSYNGGNIIDCTNEDLIYAKHIPEDLFPEICELAQRNKLALITYYKDKIITEMPDDEYVIKEAFCNGAKIMPVDDMVEFVDYPVAKCLIVGRHDRLVPVREKLLEKYGARIDAFFSEEYFLEVVPCHVRKDLSLDALLSKLDIKSSELIAVGDGLNDIPMLKFAGLGVAVANAYAPVKDVADLIGLSNEDCAVAKIIEDYML